MTIIICGGLKRTGSLAMFQVMREIVESKGVGVGDFRGREINNKAKLWAESQEIRVLKFHRYRAALDPYRSLVKVVMTIREPRDTLVSLMNKYGYSCERAMNSTEFRGNFYSYYRWKEQIPEQNMFIVKYERFWEKREEVIGYVADWMGFQLDPEEISHISQKWSLEANKARVGQHHETDPNFVAKRHIVNGEPGQWSAVLTQDQGQYVCDMYREWVKETGYEC